MARAAVSHRILQDHPRTTTKGSPSLITFRYGDQLVYVTPAASYDEAVKYARSEFPQLSSCDEQSISFSVKSRGTRGGEIHEIRIAPMAWKEVMQGLTQYEVITIRARPARPKGRKVDAQDQGAELLDIDVLDDESPNDELASSSAGPSRPVRRSRRRNRADKENEPEAASVRQQTRTSNFISQSSLEPPRPAKASLSRAFTWVKAWRS